MFCCRYWFPPLAKPSVRRTRHFLCGWTTSLPADRSMIMDQTANLSRRRSHPPWRRVVSANCSTRCSRERMSPSALPT